MLFHRFLNKCSRLLILLQGEEADTYSLMKLAVSFERWVLFQNGLLSAAPYLVMWIVALVSGVFVDFLVHKNVSISLVRKIFISIGKYFSTSVMRSPILLGSSKTWGPTIETVDTRQMGDSLSTPLYENKSYRSKEKRILQDLTTN